MDKIYLVENAGCEYRTFEAFSDAIMYAMELIESQNSDKVDKYEIYKELFTSMSERDIHKWGFGYTIEDYLWCWEVPFKGKSK